jgi:hypothetical protein
MPYLYILIYGKNMPVIFYVAVLFIVIVPLIFFIYKIINKGNDQLPDGIEMFKMEHISNREDVESLWNIYNHTFEPLNRISPCKQSLDHEHFIEALSSTSISKYTLHKKSLGYIGIGLITNDFKNLTWISEDYFRYKFPKEFEKKLVYYLIGIAISPEFRGNKLSIKLIESVMDDLPRDVVIGFDHSRNINPVLHHFTRVVKQAGLIKRIHIDRQHYHAVQYNK